MNRNLSPAQFYHGSAQKFAAGQTIEPGHLANYDQSSPEHVYFADSASHAAHYADHAYAMNASGKPAVYAVSPTGDYSQEYETGHGARGYRTAAPMRVLGVHEDREAGS